MQGGIESSFYTFTHWPAVDAFIYFSHHLVTIPPPCWTNAGHRNGCPVLGTLITEWDQGAAYCRELFGSREASEHTAQKLARIARAHGFDGYLVNVENVLEAEHVPFMLHFLRWAQHAAACHCWEGPHDQEAPMTTSCHPVVMLSPLCAGC